MFKHVIKLLLLTILFFSNLLYADGEEIPIYVSNPTVNETDGTVTFTITLDQAPISYTGLFINYNTRNGSASAISDYEAKTGSILDFLYFPYSISTRMLTLDIYDDAIYEGTENFYLDISTSASGYQTNSTGTATINDNEIQPLTITPFGKAINENDGTPNKLSFKVQLNQIAPVGGVDIVYNTSENPNPNEAINGSDYTDVSGTLNIPEGQNIGYIDVPILGDTLPESEEHFYLNLSSTSLGTITSSQVVGTIYDNDAIKVGIDCTNTDEGNIGDTNKIPCKIYLSKAYPVGEPALTINYRTQDGTANVTVDYTESNGTVTFNTGELEHLVYIPIIGDDEIEPHESVSMVISGSTAFINTSSSALILNDDGSYPAISFEMSDFSIVEGNSSQSMLEFTFLLDQPALAGASFTYNTWDNSAKNELQDNDYIKTSGDYNLSLGERNISISVSINGDTKIENNESFYFEITNLNKLILNGNSKVLGTIINDDGAYPVLSATSNLFSIIEGNSSQTDLNFTLTLDKAPFTGSSFDYYTTYGDTNGSDFMPLNRTTFTFSGSETNITIPVSIYGDLEIENDELFYLKIDNEKNLTISGTTSLTGKIINDDVNNKFSCSVDAYIFTSTDRSTPTNIFGYDLGTGDEITNVPNIYSRNINAIGYNVTDNYIWGYDTHNYKVARVDSLYNVTTYDISGLPIFSLSNGQNPYHVADVDSNGILYLATQSDATHIYRVDVNPSSPTYLTMLSTLNLSSPIAVSDFAFSPLNNMLYAVDYNNQSLINIDITTGTVTNLGNTTLPNTATVIATFSDNNGNLYVYDSISGDISKIVPPSAPQALITAAPFSTIVGAFDQADGARCANAPVVPPVQIDEPLVCDSSMYLSSSIKRGTGETGKMWLHKINTSSNPFSFDVVDDLGDARLYNALAYSDAGDINSTDFIFGLYNDELIKLGKAGKVMSLGTIDALSPLLNSRQLFAGAAYGGYYYVSGPGVDYDRIFKIDLSNKNVVDINLSQAISIKDFSFSSDGTSLYGIIDGGALVKINVADGNVTSIGSPHIGYEFDSTFSDKNDRFFANDSNGNGFFEFNLQTGEKNFISNSQAATYNDGANCLNASLVFNDYGDAPASYGDARHNIANGIFLGQEVDHDASFYASTNADGDDLNGIDDDDGITLVNGDDLNETYFTLNVSHELNITLAKDAYFRLWIDKDINGDFNGVNELIYDSGVKLTAGSHTISFSLPLGLQTNTLTYLRARVSSTPNLSATAFAIDGEVEDYAIKFGTDAIRGTFNIERIDSSTYTVNSKIRNAWYTQIVGHDFDYSILFYEEDFSAGKPIDNISLKVELIDMDTNTTLYERSAHIVDNPPVQRINIIIPFGDLKNLPATKNARFAVTYGINADGSIIQANCLANPSLCSLTRTDYARDNFAIRPESFYINLSDKNTKLVGSQDANSTVNLAAGYEYNLTVIATKHDINGKIIPAQGYTTNLYQKLDFNTSGTCINTDSIDLNIAFNEGEFNTSTFSHNNIGKYILDINDNNWTNVDQNTTLLGCVENSSSNIANLEGKVGCEIALYLKPIEMNFQPHHFDVDLTMQNLPNSGHPDFIYMMELNATNDNVAISFEGNITAQSEDNTTTTNFTVGCVATNILLDLNATTISVEGTNQDIFTTDNIIPVNFSRVIRFNSEINSSNFELNNTLRRIGRTFSIDSSRFLNDNNGTMSLDIRYNLNKNLQQPINPIEVTFNSIEVNSEAAKSSAYQINNYVPKGISMFPNNVKNFYFAKVVSNLNNYPRVNMNISPLIMTPLNVDIYCATTINNYCEDRNVILNSILSSTTREQNGWYLSAQHNGALDGNVTALIDNPNILTITPNPTPVGADDISLSNGANGTVNAVFNNCSSPSSTVTIVTDPVLAFEPSEYTVNCTNTAPSQWTGIGQTGNVLKIKPKVDKSGKMDW